VAKTYSSVPGTERKETVPCPCCRSPRARPFLSCEGFGFVRCRDCATVFQNPRPVFEDLRKRYGPDYFSYELANEGNFFRLMRLGLQDIRFREQTASLQVPRAFLDVGCATGMLIESMRAEGWEVRGVDVCRESAEHGKARRGVEIFPGTLEEAHFSDESFNAVHFSHLIEHVPDPPGFLAEVKRILAPGGYAVITTPNMDGFQARLFGKAWRSAIADHLVLFSRRTLIALLRKEGFEVCRSVTWGGLAVGTAPRLIKEPMDRMAKAWGFGDVVMVLAAKR
jgi:2-polyprenyl-3-methyl-5-hydroxy-6-metoxy-1,4-benzoquinol methylase